HGRDQCTRNTEAAQCAHPGWSKFSRSRPVALGSREGHARVSEPTRAFIVADTRATAISWRTVMSYWWQRAARRLGHPCSTSQIPENTQHCRVVFCHTFLTSIQGGCVNADAHRAIVRGVSGWMCVNQDRTDRERQGR